MGMARIPSSLHIVSWNVASWPTTAANIIKFHGSLTSWLDKHNIDILCLQEVKATRAKMIVPSSGWETFLSPNLVRPGLNGVATLVRKNRYLDFPIVGADPTPFAHVGADSNLCQQGRCILTDHGVFTLINVYVPYDGECGSQIELKLNFLTSLHALILQIKKTKRPVVCVGDFNVARNPRDLHYEFRRINLDDLVENLQTNIELAHGKIGYPLSNQVVGILVFLSQNWSNVKKKLIENRSVQQINGNKYVLKICGISIGQRQFSKSVCENTANPEPVHVGSFVYKSEGVLCVSDLFEVLSKVENFQVSMEAKIAFSDVFANVPRSCVADIWDKLLSECKLVDTYLHVNSAARPIGSERFTCWDQSRNDRYENRGTRIDYILADESVISSVRLAELPKSIPLLSTSSERSTALRAATAEGQWRPVPFSGVREDNFVACTDFEFKFSNPPQTGIIYTHPVFSDHVATSVVIDMSTLPTENINQRTSDHLGSLWANELRKCSVNPQVSLKSMFSSGNSVEKKPRIAM